MRTERTEPISITNPPRNYGGGRWTPSRRRAAAVVMERTALAGRLTIQGYSPSQIAAELGVSVRVAQRTVQRAREMAERAAARDLYPMIVGQAGRLLADSVAAAAARANDPENGWRYIQAQAAATDALIRLLRPAGETDREKPAPAVYINISVPRPEPVPAPAIPLGLAADNRTYVQDGGNQERERSDPLKLIEQHSTHPQHTYPSGLPKSD